MWRTDQEADLAATDVDLLQLCHPAITSPRNQKSLPGGAGRGGGGGGAQGRGGARLPRQEG
ncbi:hypothetical protein EYF80_019041 [Liparis tanakae]|uniref:Uncharacterized protein n=1 Tax=Liparis tanakae TaxID=230148 RepID=A0A4Z2HYM3_9TELE|nr:hypothetical protein EYF80_019041 [Liparis tanakae]